MVRAVIVQTCRGFLYIERHIGNSADRRRTSLRQRLMVCALGRGVPEVQPRRGEDGIPQAELGAFPPFQEVGGGFGDGR